MRSKTITINMSTVFDLTGLILGVSLVVSFLACFGTKSGESVCQTNAYYLPATFIMCSILKEK